MAAKKTTLNELGEMLAHVVEHMATKDDLTAVRKELKSDIAALSEQVTSIERELKTIRRDLNDLMNKFENVAGYRKEIDHALARIAAIEKHLGLGKKTSSSHATQ
jgi:septal ring factor EnvC (AmiA/AmiB activator)